MKQSVDIIMDKTSSQHGRFHFLFFSESDFRLGWHSKTLGFGINLPVWPKYFELYCIAIIKNQRPKPPVNSELNIFMSSLTAAGWKGNFYNSSISFTTNFLDTCTPVKSSKCST